MATSHNPLNLLTTITIAIMLCILLCISTSSLIKTCKAINSLKEMHGKTRHILLLSMTFLTVILFTFASICALLVSIEILIDGDIYNNSLVIWTGNIAILLYVTSQSVMLFVFTIRIEVTFANTALKYSNKLIKSLKIAATLLSMFGLLAMVFLFTGRLQLTLLCGLFWTIIQVTLSITLCILFIKPIEKLMTNQMENSTSEKSGASVTSVTSTESKDVKAVTDCDMTSTPRPSVAKSLIDADFLFVVIKHGILVPIAIISSFIFNMTSITISQVLFSGGYSPLSLCWLIVDATLSSICTYLLCGVNKRYYGILCWKIHSMCERRKLKKIVLKVKKRKESLPDCNKDDINTNIEP